MNYIKKQYQTIHAFYRTDFKKPLIIISILFFGIILVSTVFFLCNKSMTMEAMSWVQQTLSTKDVVDAQGNISAFGLIRNNLQACLLCICLGFIPFLFLNFFPLLVNTVMMGIVVAGSHFMGRSFAFTLAALLPHGIFEIPAIILSITLGYYICIEFVMKIVGNRTGVSLAIPGKHMIRVFLCIVLPLLLVAGIVEAYITPVVAGFFL